MKNPEDIVLPYANKHDGNVNVDWEFDCENNCPYCNDEKICIQPIDVHVIESYFADPYGFQRTMKCHLCGKYFYDIWKACDADDDGYIFNELISYESYEYTVLDAPSYLLGLIQLPKREYPIYRRLTPEIVDMFDLGPVESRFELLDIRDDVLLAKHGNAPKLRQHL